MDHEAAQALFSAHVDGELAEAQRVELDAHLAACEACRHELDAFRQTVGAMHAVRRAGPSPAFLDSLRTEIRTRSRGRFFGERRRRYGLEIASLVTLALALGIYVVLRFAQPLLLPP